DDLARFYEDTYHRLTLTGDVAIRLPGEVGRGEPPSYAVNGRLQLFVPRYKPYGIGARDDVRRRAQEAAAGQYRPQRGEPRRFRSSRRGVDQRVMEYDIRFAAAERHWLLTGYKRIRDDPGIDAWRDASSLFVRLFELESDEPDAARVFR